MNINRSQFKGFRGANPVNVSRSATKPLRESQISFSSLNLVIAWYAFLLVGAILIAIEFEAFNRAGITKEQIGWLLGAWGMGSFIAFFMAAKNKLQATSISLLMMVAFGAFPFVSQLYILVGFFVVGGYANAKFSGSLRAQLQKEESKNPFRATDFWSLIQKRLALINILAYITVAQLIQYNQWNLAIAALGFSLAGLQLFTGRLQHKDIGA